MRPSISILICCFSYGCTAAQVNLDSEDELGTVGGDTETSDGDDSDVNNDPTGEEEEEEVEVEEEVEPTYEGDYAGSFWFDVYSYYWDFELEDCETQIEVNDEGKIEGSAMCMVDAGWGEPTEQTFDIEGEASSAGDVSGTIFFQLEWGDAIDLDLYGTISDDLDMRLSSEGEYESDWAVLTIYGEGELQASD